MTLYASSAARALMLSKEAAGGIHRAGDIADDGRPIIVEDIDSIDATLTAPTCSGLEFLCHRAFDPQRREPDRQVVTATAQQPLAEIRGMPEGERPPKWWLRDVNA